MIKKNIRYHTKVGNWQGVHMAGVYVIDFSLKIELNTIRDISIH